MYFFRKWILLSMIFWDSSVLLHLLGFYSFLFPNILLHRFITIFCWLNCKKKWACFQLGPITNRTVRNMLVRGLFVNIYFHFSSAEWQNSWLMWQVYCWVYKNLSKCFPKRVLPFFMSMRYILHYVLLHRRVLFGPYICQHLALSVSLALATLGKESILWF